MVDFLGTIVTPALMVAVVNALVVYLEDWTQCEARAGGHLRALDRICRRGIRVRLAHDFGPLSNHGNFVAAPLVAAAPATAWPRVRAGLLQLPTPLMIGLNFGRVFAVLFLLLALQGRLAGPFPFFAGWGDIVTGVLAVPLLFAAADRKHTGAIMAWNLFGTADLVPAIFLGVTSGEGSPLQIFTTAPGSAAMQQLPWSFVPTVLVPFWLILHAVIWVQLRWHTNFSHPANAIA